MSKSIILSLLKEGYWKKLTCLWVTVYKFTGTFSGEIQGQGHEQGLEYTGLTILGRIWQTVYKQALQRQDLKRTALHFLFLGLLKSPWCKLWQFCFPPSWVITICLPVLSLLQFYWCCILSCSLCPWGFMLKKTNKQQKKPRLWNSFGGVQ